MSDSHNVFGFLDSSMLRPLKHGPPFTRYEEVSIPKGRREFLQKNSPTQQESTEIPLTG